jgi:small GTP-binding protein
MDICHIPIFALIQPLETKSFFQNNLLFQKIFCRSPAARLTKSSEPMLCDDPPAIPPRRVVMIGDSQTGKTSISNYISGRQTQSVLPTIGVSVVQSLSISSMGGHFSVPIALWDTAGQEKYRGLGPIYYHGADAAMAVFDLTSATSFDHLDNWIQTFIDVAGERIVCILANKTDLTDREVSPEQVLALKTMKRCECFETSAYTGEGIREALGWLAEQLVVREPLSGHGIRFEPKEKGECC